MLPLNKIGIPPSGVGGCQDDPPQVIDLASQEPV